MLKIGITGQAGFVGTHLYHTIGLYTDRYELIAFEDSFFADESKLQKFVRGCDVIVHLAAMNRHPDPRVIYQTNIHLVRQLIEAMEAEAVVPHILFSSSTQEEQDNAYGRSKREGRELLEQWARNHGGCFTGMVVPNVFGPFGRPNYNSVISTFCHQLTHGETPCVLQDSEVKFIYVGSLCRHIIEEIDAAALSPEPFVELYPIPHDFKKKVSELLVLFQYYQTCYFEQGVIPTLKDINAVNLFNTFRSYIDYNSHFPVRLIRHTDPRGSFVETIRLGIGGQVSFSTTLPGIIRGNHYHTRKIERFTVIKGQAKIQLRRIGTNEILDFYLDGTEPSYVDMPIWYTHNITNIGEEELYTQFWINEWYDPKDGDTYFETV